MTKELLSNVRHKEEEKKGVEAGELTQRTTETMSKHAGIGLGRKSLSGVESSKSSRATGDVSTGTQASKRSLGKMCPTDEWSRDSAGKRLTYSSSSLP